MVLSKSIVRSSNVPVVSLYMPALSNHLPSEWDGAIKDVKQEVVAIGGCKNASCRFLKPGCTDNNCNSANSVVCRGVLQIPRTKDISAAVLRKLDRRKPYLNSGM